MRALLSIVAGVALAVGGTLAIAGSAYTPPASSGGGVEGDGTGVTDASAFRSALSLGTAATANTGTSMGNVVALGVGAALPAVNASNLTGISSAQVSGLGTAAGYSATSFLQAVNNLSDVTPSTARSNLGLGTAATLNTGTGAGNIVVLDGSAKLPAVDGSLLTSVSPYAADTWTYTWSPSDGDPIAANGWTAVQSATTASTTVDGVACYSITPSGASGESSIYKNVGAASSSSWEARVLLWTPNGNTSRFGWTYDSGIGTTDALYKVTTSGTTTPLRVNEAAPTVPALQYTTRWVMWTLRCWYNISTTQTCELYAGRIKLYTFESATADAAVSAGRLTIGRTIGAVVTAGCIGGVWVRSTGVNEAPVEYRERARQF